MVIKLGQMWRLKTSRSLKTYIVDSYCEGLAKWTLHNLEELDSPSGCIYYTEDMINKLFDYIDTCPINQIGYFINSKYYAAVKLDACGNIGSFTLMELYEL